MIAQYDVCSLPDGAWVVVVQSGSIDVYDTRVVIPLVPDDDDQNGVSRLTPSLTIREDVWRLATQLVSVVPRRALSTPVASLEGERLKIQAALDLLLNGS